MESPRQGAVRAVPTLPPELPSEYGEEVDHCGQATHKAQEFPLISSVFWDFCRKSSPFCLEFAGWNGCARLIYTVIILIIPSYWLPTTAFRLIQDRLLP